MSKDLAHDARVEHHLDHAIVALDAGLLTEAQTQVEACVRLEPGHLAARLVEARVHLTADRPVDALAAIEAMNLYDPDNARLPQAAMLRAESLMRADMNAMAGAQLQEFIAQFPDDVRAHRLLAQLNIRQERFDDAVHCLEQVVRLAPSDDASRRMLAQLIADAQPKRSIDLLESTTEPSAATRMRLAELYRLTQRHHDAQDIYTELMAEYPNDPSVWQAAGELADRDGAVDTAAARLRRAAALESRRGTSALSALSMTHLHAGRFDTAGRYWWRVTRRAPYDMRAWAGLLVSAVMCDRTRLAQRAVRRLEVRTSKSERRDLIADLWQRAAGGRVIAQATAQASTAADGHPNSLDRLIRRAADVLERHAQQYPRRADTNYHLATAHETLGRLTAARKAVSAALDVNPSYRAAANMADRLHTRPPMAA